MAFGDFAFPEVHQDLGLTVLEADLFSQVPAIVPRDDFLATLAEGATLALAINTEKAKSEFIIAPLLLELRRLMGGAIGLFSGVELDVDAAKGLNGVCDFILTKENVFLAGSARADHTRFRLVDVLFQPDVRDARFRCRSDRLERWVARIIHNDQFGAPLAQIARRHQREDPMAIVRRDNDGNGQRH